MILRQDQSEGSAQMAGAKPIRLYEELRRRRRAGWIYSLICLVVARGIGVLLSSFVTLLLLLIAGLALKLSVHIGISPRLIARSMLPGLDR
ncbi:MAG TPA: hypothetical protein VGJ20_32365 [Xanthobacteraceae bacterium]|jgi:hypothetical protein